MALAVESEKKKKEYVTQLKRHRAAMANTLT